MAYEFDEGSLGHKRAIYGINVLYIRAQPVSLIIQITSILCYCITKSVTRSLQSGALSPSWSVPVCLTSADIFIRDEWAAASHFPSRPNTCRDVIDRGRARGETLTRKFELHQQFSATFNSALVHLKWDLMRWHHISALQGGNKSPDSQKCQSSCWRERRFGQKSLQCEEKIVGICESNGITDLGSLSLQY